MGGNRWFQIKTFQVLMFISGVSVLTSLASPNFHLVNISKSYEDAKTHCREQYTDLASVRNRAEMNMLTSLDSRLPDRAWIGLEVGAVWTWHWSWPDHPLDYFNWRSGEPQATDRDACAAMDQSGEWFERDCSQERSFVCGGDSGSSAPTFVSSTKSWRGAQDHCRGLDLDLVNILSETDNRAVRNVSTAPEVWIGLFKDRWRWADGSNSSFRYWRPSQPNYLEEQECAAAIFRAEGKWNDLRCGRKRRFICGGANRFTSTSVRPTTDKEGTTSHLPTHNNTNTTANITTTNMTTNMPTTNMTTNTTNMTTTNMTTNVMTNTTINLTTTNMTTNMPTTNMTTTNMTTNTTNMTTTNMTTNVTTNTTINLTTTNMTTNMPTTNMTTTNMTTNTTNMTTTNMTTNTTNMTTTNMTTTNMTTNTTNMPTTNMPTTNMTTNSTIHLTTNMPTTNMTTNTTVNMTTNVPTTNSMTNITTAPGPTTLNTTDGIHNNTTTTTTTTTAQNTTQLSTLTPAGNSHLLLIHQNLTWLDAMTYCRERHHDLVHVTTSEVQRQVEEALKNATTAHVWLGLRYTCKFNFWFWAGSTSACFQNWAPGHGLQRTYDCGVTGAVEATGGQQWVGLPETERLNFICSACSG